MPKSSKMWAPLMISVAEYKKERTNLNKSVEKEAKDKDGMLSRASSAASVRSVSSASSVASDGTTVVSSGKQRRPAAATGWSRP